jgi:hypothetical protein
MVWSYVAAKDIWHHLHPGVELIVGRGTQSMDWLYFTYVATTVAFGLAVQVSKQMKGHKACILILNYILLTYLFLFSAWFRNTVVFQLLGIASQD